MVARDAGEQSQGEQVVNIHPAVLIPLSPAEKGLLPSSIPFALLCFALEGASLCRMELEEPE